MGGEHIISGGPETRHGSFLHFTFAMDEFDYCYLCVNKMFHDLWTMDIPREKPITGVALCVNNNNPFEINISTKCIIQH